MVKKLRSRPKDFTFEEAEALLTFYDYSRSNKGHTSGSRIAFVSEGHPPIYMHKPNPRKELLDYQVKQLLEMLEQEGLI